MEVVLGTARPAGRGSHPLLAARARGSSDVLSLIGAPCQTPDAIGEVKHFSDPCTFHFTSHPPRQEELLLIERLGDTAAFRGSVSALLSFQPGFVRCPGPRAPHPVALSGKHPGTISVTHPGTISVTVDKASLPAASSGSAHPFRIWC